MDFLGDIGGLYSALWPVCSLGVALLQFRGSYMFLMSDMLNPAPNLAAAPPKDAEESPAN